MRYTYLGDKLTRPDLVGVRCDPVSRADGLCIVGRRLAVALVQLSTGERHVVPRRRLRLNGKEAA